MKKQTVLKKLISSIMVAIIVLGQFSSYRFVSEAATISVGQGPIYVSLSKTNSTGNGYAFDMNESGGLGKNIWSMLTSTDENGSNAQHASNIYCIKAEYSGTWQSNSSLQVKYNKSHNIPLTQASEQKTANDVLLGEYQNELLWLIDNLYIPGESDESDFSNYLKNAGIIYEQSYGYSYVPSTEHDYTDIVSTSSYAETVTEEDIIAIQQAAIWYFTNYGENDNVYDKTGTANWIQYTNNELLADATGKNKYPQLSTISKARAEHAIVIYNYLINEAKNVAETLGSNIYELKYSNAKLWLSLDDSGNIVEEQPVIEVHKLEEKPFDLSLRKAIVAINGNKELVNTNGESATRELNEDGSIKVVGLESLNSGTTATYKHRKDPVVVEKGDVITYAITIYNEAEEAGYANKIVDQLPGTFSTGLRLDNNNAEILTSTTGNKYKLEYVASTNTITLTMTQDSPKNVLAPYNVETGALASETILVDCVVMGKPDAANSKILTNVAYIAEEYNAYYNTIITNATIQDRDSKTWESPQVVANSLVTTEIGYTGNQNNSADLSSNDTYYAGEQDDDDFEKIIILPKSFDLSLRKNITKVNNEEVKNTRVPNIETTDLDAGNKTTAEYKHRKDAVSVENGDTVEYNIWLHNEGSISGVATIVKDQLPSGLKLNKEFFTKEGEEYFVTSNKGNVYKVTYDENNNLVIFQLDETKTTNVALLAAHTIGQELDKDLIVLQCLVDCKPDDDQNTFLTNIAYIYEARQEDGTVVTNQVAGTENGSEADRDSEPHTYPEESAEQLKTIGNVGYIGSQNNSTDLAQNNIHFAGEQDDDDFEKLVILPEAFDLSLRKYITKVDKIEVENSRVPKKELTNLDNGASTTAEYKHRKDPLVVEDGSSVEYVIAIYNEGAIDGVATRIKDKLPVGVKLNISYFDERDNKYFVTSSTGNIYEVIYSQETNVVEFKLDKTRTSELKYLRAHQINSNLEEEKIVLECIVDYMAHETKNVYFTNIAYIYEAEQVDGTIITNQESGSDSDRDSEPHTYTNKTANDLTTIGTVGYTGNSNNPSNLAQDNVHFAGEQDDDDFEKLVMLPKTFDLKLIKFVTAINDEETANRVLSIDTSKLSAGEETTAEYILEKNPVSVKGGDFVTYTIRVYNEGNYDGYAIEISEDIPEGLEFIVITDGTIYTWDGVEQIDITEKIKTSDMYEKIVEINSNWGYKQGSTTITTGALSEDLIKGFGQNGVQYADEENKIDYKEVQVIFRVKEEVEPNLVIRNEAAISQDKAVDKEENEIDIKDRDSKTEEWKKEDSDKNYDEKGKWPIYKEDDEDYDNIITKVFDLSLRKQIIKINNSLYTQRFAKLDSTGIYENTIYDYYDVYSDKPKVKAGDTVVYSIRVYNEGDIDGYASLVVDTIPDGLEFVEYEPGDKSINDQYGWTLVKGKENLYQTDYLSYEKDINKGTAKSTILKAYDGEGEASYQEIYIECKVKEDVTKEDSLLNVAQIAEDSDSEGNSIKDKDSVPGTSDDESKWKVEDDLDIEILELQEFDLALRKFITKIENGEKVKDVTTRIPQVSYDTETGKIIYTHPKEALTVHVEDTVIYTIRVYNEGDIDGYASEIKDDIPEYLEFLPEHKINIEYEWVMYDKEGKKTENVGEAVCIRTEHLAKGHGLEKGNEGSNLIKAFNPNAEISEENPDYKEVEVAFKVKDPNSTEYEIINFAQISEDSDSKGDPIKDRDSVPDNGEKDPKEDDEDIEKIKVEYFDLSLLKYVTKVLVNENGQERVIETGNVGDEKDIIPHVQIQRKNIDKTIVKFVYTIKVTNEGQIAGEVTEITDYVPEGLVFVEEDNEYWKDEGNNVISTRQLTGSTLQPGESVEVEVVLRWINGKDNLGPKTNIAEISEDYNEENIPDKDSTPDNKKDGEDDIDDATVILSVNQGGGIQGIYMNLAIIFLSIILVGGILIKKFLL